MQFLAHLVVTEKVLAFTQNQAMNAIIFLYRVVLQQDLAGIDAVRAKRSRYLPTVLTPDEVQRVLHHLYGVHKLVVQLLYGSGLRLSEGLQLRVENIDLAQHQLVIRDTKGKESCVTILPTRIVESLQAHLQMVRQLHHQDLDRGYGSVYLPFALERKYPQARSRLDLAVCVSGRFLADRLSQDPRSGVARRHHLHETGVQQAVREAVRAAGIEKRVTCHTFRHSESCPLIAK
jgi:integrase